MGTVKASQHEEGGAVDPRIQGQPIVAVGFVVFECLKNQEDRPQSNSHDQPSVQFFTVLSTQGMVGPGEGHARGHQQQGVDQRQGPGIDQLVWFGKAFTGRELGQRPFGRELRPQHVGDTFRPLTTEPGHREGPHIKQGAEERREKHHFGKDEPTHPHHERAVQLVAVHARLVFADHLAKPGKKHHRHQHEAGHHPPQ